MSAISSSGASQGLFQYLQSLSVGSQSTTVSSTTATAATTATTTAGSGQGVQGAGGRRHHHGGGGGELFKKIQSAVTDALKSAQGDAGTDANKAVEDAIAKVLQQNGATPPTTAGDQTINAPGVTPAAGEQDTDGKVGNDASASNRQAFFQTLKSYGIDPQQFRQDFLSAIKDAQNGTANSGAALQSLPTGLTVDTTA